MRCEHLCKYCISSKRRGLQRDVSVQKVRFIGPKGTFTFLFSIDVGPPQNTPWVFGCRPKQSQSFNQVPPLRWNLQPCWFPVDFPLNSMVEHDDLKVCKTPHHPVDLRIKIWLVDWLLVPVQYSAWGWPWVSVSNRPAYTDTTDFLFEIGVGFGATRRSKSRNNLSTKVMRSV